jgi:SAM-dependent methyltransferase
MTEFYGADLAAIHAEAFEALAVSAAETLIANVEASAFTGRLLDIGCGAGPLSLRVAGHGFSVWGVDLSASLIQRARERLPEGEFVCGSVVHFALPQGSAAVAVGEVLNYATTEDGGDLARIFRRVFDALEPGGVFLFDLAGPGRGGAAGAFTEGKDWAVGMIATEHDGLLVRKITSFRREADGDWRRTFEEHRLRLWSVADVTGQLASVGFEVAQLDGYSGLKLPPALQVYLARRPISAQKP